MKPTKTSPRLALAALFFLLIAVQASAQTFDYDNDGISYFYDAISSNFCIYGMVSSKNI